MPRSRSRSRSPAGAPKRTGYRGGSGEVEEMSRTLFIANISDEADEHDVQKLFTGFGFNLAEVSLPRFAADRNHRGYGFVHLADSRDIQEAIDKSHGYDFFGRPLKVEVKNPRVPPRKGRGKKGGRGDSRRRDSRGRGGGRGRSDRRDSRDRRGGGGGRRDSRRR